MIDNTQATSYEFKDIPVTMTNCTITRDLKVGSGEKNITQELTDIKNKLNEVIRVVNQALNRNISPI